MATPPVFTAGQVLTAAQMNAVGLWKVDSGTFSAVTSVSLPNGTFTADYDNYRLMFVLTTVATDATLTGRMRDSGTDNSGSNYQFALRGMTTGATPVDANSAGTTSFAFMTSDNTVIRYAASIDIYGPAIARATNLFSTVVSTSTTAIFQYQVGGQTHNLANAYDSFSFISTQNITGSYWVYGYNT
jgi:hypothetical protein